jgi:hypothetical protein
MDTSLVLAPPRPAGCLPTMRGTAARYFRVAVPTVAGVRSGKSAGNLRLHALAGKAWDPVGAAAACAGYSGARQAGGEGGHSRAGCPGTAGLPAPGTAAPARGLCAPGTAHSRAPPAPGCPVPADSVRQHGSGQRRAAETCRRVRRRGGRSPVGQAIPEGFQDPWFPGSLPT